MQKLVIKKILIKESPAFKEASFEPHLHFNVFSGASGAGKSVLMESILALFGLRECNATLLEATLQLQGIPQEFEGLIDEGEAIITISKKDKVRYFLNAQNIPKKKIQELFLPFLKHLGTKSYDAIATPNLFLAFDSFCNAKDKKHGTILKQYEKSFLHFTQITKELNTLKEESLKVAELKEFVRFEIQKLEALNPKKGEYEELLIFKKEISKKEKIKESLQAVQELLSHTHKISNFLHCINKEHEILGALNSFEFLCEQEEEKLNALDEANIEEILNRIEALSNLKHRYGGIDEALEYLENKKQELKKYENLDTILKEMEQKHTQATQQLQDCANALNTARKKYLIDFESTLNMALKTLKMQNAKVELIPQEQYTMFGKDLLEITLNGALKNLSSGEFNRFRLALLLTQNTNAQEAIIILDEVDANLSGEESEGVAKSLKSLSKHYQIFAISHQPHMPSLADEHFLVQKQSDTSRIISLNKEGRIQEIARMISGDVITQEALDFASKRLEA